jgi:CheY-like chemotaxis protein
LRAGWNDRVTETANLGTDVLVIDDDSVMRELVADWLDAAGYRVCKAIDCQAALAQAERARPQLIVTDMCMPGASGAIAIARLRQQHPGARIIAISGHFKSGHGLSAEEALAAGALRAFGKPVKRAEFISAVAEVLGLPA